MASNGMNLKVNVVLDPNQGYKEFNSWSNKVQAQVNKNPIKVKIDVDGQQYEKSIETWIGKNHDLVEVTKLVNTATKQEIEYISKVEDGMSRLANATSNQVNQTRNLSNAQSKLNTHAQKSISIFQDFTNTFLKMAKFNTINLIYDAIIDGMNQAIEVTEKLNAATTEFQKVSELSGESLSEYTQHLGDLGAEVARTTSEMIEGATSFRKSGFTDEESAQLAKVSAMFQNIADEELSASDAAQILISTMKGFDLEVNQVEHIADSINEVSNSFSVSSSDISNGLANVSAVASMANNSLEETTGMLTAMVEISQSAGKSSRGLRQIITRLTQTLDESSSTGKKLKEIYAGLGIEITDQNGTLRGTYDILKDLAQQWKHLDANQQQYIALTSAGANQIQNFTALMNNFDTAIEATETAFNSAGSAMRENQTYIENSIEAHKKALQAEYENLITSLPLEELEKRFLDVSLAVLKFIDSIGGFQTVLLAVGTVIAMTLVPATTTLIANIGTLASTVITLVGNFYTAYTGGMSFSMALETVGVAGLSTTAALQGLVAVLGGIIIAFNMYNQAQEKAKKAAYDANQEALNQTNTLQQQLHNLEKENQSREDLVKAIKAVDSAYQDEGQSLDDINKKRKESIKALKEENRAKLESAKSTGWEQYVKDTRTLSGKGYQSFTTKNGTGITNEIVDRYQSEARARNVEFNADNLEDYIASLKRLQDNVQSTGGTIRGLSNDISHAEDVLNEAKQGVDQYNQILEALNLKYNAETGAIEKMTEAEIAEKEAEAEVIEQKAKTIDLINELGIHLDEISDKLSEEDSEKLEELLDAGDLDGAIELLAQYGIELDNIGESADDTNGIMGDFFDGVEDLQNAYEVLIKASQEYNKNGTFTAATLKKLNKLQPEYLALLYQEGDAYTNITEGLNGYLDTEKKDAKLKVEIARMTALVQISQKALNDETAKSDEYLDDFGTAASDASDDVAKLKNLTGQLAINMGTLRNQGKVDEGLVAQLQSANEYFDGLSASIDNVFLGIESSASGAAGKTKDAWVQAFEEEKDALKNLLETDQINEYEYYQRLAELNEKYFGEISGNHEKYIKEYRENEEEIYKGMKEVYDKVRDYLKEAVEQGYEKAINALKKEEKAVLAEIKKQIEAIKKEKEEVIKGIEKQIKALKKEKEAVEKYYNDQIDAIKRENEVLQQQNELLEKQQELQKAKQQKVMVMHNGRFQLTENESAVSQAEQNLSNYEDQLSYEQQIQQLEDLRDAQVETIEERIEALEEYKDYMEEYYDEQIEAMEEYYDQVQEQYELQIEALQEELDTFKEGYQKEEDLENARLAAQVLGMNERKDLYAQELENLKNYINEVNRMLESLGQAGVQVDYGYSPITGYHQGIAEVAGVDMALETRASGDASFGKDDVALVGESPNAELLLGSHVNTIGGGKLMHLQKGTGVVNAESTQTLAGILNGLSTPSTNVANNRSTQQNFSFGAISLPNVTDADSFVNTLSHKFNNYAIQYGNTRK